MSMATAQAAEVADLKQKRELADEDNSPINRQLDEAQGMFLGHPAYACVIVCARS